MDSSVAVSELLGVAAVVPPTELPVVAQLTPLIPQGSHLSSARLSPNRVRPDFDVDMVDLDPLFDTFPRSDGALPLISPITTPGLPSSPASSSARTLPVEAESFDSAGVSPATSMSITDRTAELQLLSPPLVPLPPSIQVRTDPALLLQLATAYDEWLHQPPPVPVADSPFDAVACPAATRDHLLTNVKVVPTVSLLTGMTIMPWWTLRSEHKYTIPISWSRWGRRSRPTCSAGHPRSGYRLCLGRRTCARRCNFNVTPISCPRT